MQNEYQVILISSYKMKIYKAFLEYFDQNNVNFDGIYQDIRDKACPGIDYSQIIKDFEISSDQMSTQVLVSHKLFKNII